MIRRNNTLTLFFIITFSTISGMNKIPSLKVLCQKKVTQDELNACLIQQFYYTQDAKRDSRFVLKHGALIKFLVEEGADKQLTPLLYHRNFPFLNKRAILYCMQGNIKTIRALSNINGVSFTTTISGDQLDTPLPELTPLWGAVLRGHTEVVRFLIKEKNVPVNLTHLQPFIETALAQEDTDIVNLLLDAALTTEAPVVLQKL